MEEPVSTRVMRGHFLQELAREDLEAYGAEELRERIQQLRDEIDRRVRDLLAELLPQDA